MSDKVYSHSIGGKIALKGAFGKFLTLERNGQANAIDAIIPVALLHCEDLLVIPQGGNRFTFRSHHNTFLVAEQDGSLNADSNQIGSQEEFQVACNKE